MDTDRTGALAAVSRGFDPGDERDFKERLPLLLKAAKDVSYLLEAGYEIKSAVTFVGNHYLLSGRQRLALARSLTTGEQLRGRKERELGRADLKGASVQVDTFNTVISLEVALSGNLLLLGMDGMVRDLSGLRGSYRLIGRTGPAVEIIRRELERAGVRQASFYLDQPVSNSGRLTGLIREVFSDSPVETDFFVIPDVDRVLMQKEGVISSDAVILDHCRSFYNLLSRAIEAEGLSPFLVRLSPGEEKGTAERVPLEEGSKRRS